MHALLWPLLALPWAAAQTAVSLSIPSSLPATAQLLPGPLLGMSIEQDRFPDWAGPIASPNLYTRQVLQNIVDRSGTPPPIRVGGNTEDKTHYSAAVEYTDNTYPAVTNTTPYPEATTVVVGTEFWQLAGNFLPGTEFTFGINLKAQDPYEAALEAQLIYQAFGELEAQGSGVALRLLELGNEPDLYAGGWTIEYYVEQWNALASAIQASLSTPPSMQILSFANPSNSSNFTVTGALATGLLNGTLSSLVRTVSEHHYQGSFCEGSGGAVADLMDKTYVRGNLSAFPFEIAKAESQGWDFELGETNSVSCHGAPGLSNTAGAAIWAVDYALQAATLGIKRLYFHNGIGYKYDFFDPYYNISDGTPYTAPHILPLYHALLITAEATSYPGPVYIGEIGVENNYVAAYGVWGADSGSLLRVVIVNSDPWFSYSTPASARPTYAYTLSGLTPSSPIAGSFPESDSFQLRRLNVTGADVTSGVEWAGQSFETATGAPSGDRVNEVVTGTTFGGWASEVVVVYFQEG